MQNKESEISRGKTESPLKMPDIKQKPHVEKKIKRVPSRKTQSVAREP
jgi:hypothetical protein